MLRVCTQWVGEACTQGGTLPRVHREAYTGIYTPPRVYQGVQVSHLGYTRVYRSLPKVLGGLYAPHVHLQTGRGEGSMRLRASLRTKRESCWVRASQLP